MCTVIYKIALEICQSIVIVKPDVASGEVYLCSLGYPSKQVGYGFWIWFCGRDEEKR
jgi:hypothetical protein